MYMDEERDTYVNKDTVVAAKLAAGGAIDLCKAVANGTLKNGFAGCMCQKACRVYFTSLDSLEFCSVHDLKVYIECETSFFQCDLQVTMQTVARRKDFATSTQWG